MNAPSEFVTIGLDAPRFRKAAPDEFHGPCPFCGGTDRFRVHTDKPFPHWYAVCREGSGCGWKGWADEINPRLREPITAEIAAKYAAEARSMAERNAATMAARLREFSDSDLWAELNRRMNAQNRAWWEAQGVPEDWQNYWQLGYTNATAWGAAYTIPYFSEGWQAVNMQYRLTNPPEHGDKYRWAGLGYSSHWTAHPALAEHDKVVVCEGAKKAMVYTTLTMSQDVQVYAVPSKSDFAGVADKARAAGRVWVVLDPDATDQAEKLARQIGPNARVVEVTEKLDDAITQFGASKRDLAAFFRQARRVA
jgi:hypothetical protein